MVTPIEFLNAPIYSVGDSFLNRGSESSSSGRGSEYLSYSYDSWDNHSASEYYQMGEQAPSAVVRYEDFHYSADSASNIVNDVSSYVSITTYDSISRDINSDQYSILLYDWGMEERSSSSSFVYVDENSNRLVSSSESESSSYTSFESNDSDLNLNQITYTYDYTGLRDDQINGPWDYTTRWGVGISVNSNSEGDTDSFMLYSKESRTQGRQGDAWQEMRVEIDEVTGVISHTHISDDQYGNGSSSYSNFYTSDYDLDGIIDSMSQYSNRYQRGTSMSNDLQKDDYDGDGQADYIFMSRERATSQGISRTEYVYNTQIASRPVLEIRRTIDIDGDGIPESDVQNAMFRTLTPRHTSMGDHALTLEDVMYSGNEIVS